jgi:predicted phage-related endonuclease
VPDTYYAQGQHYSTVLDVPMTIYGAFVGLDLVIRHVRANEEFRCRMIEAESVIFHDFIQKGVLPAPSGNEAEDEVVSALYSEPTKEAVDLTAYKDKAARHVELAAAIKALDTEKRQIASELKMAIGNASVGMMPGYKATWSRFETSRFDKERFEKEHPELLAQYTSKEQSGRFTVTALK